MREQRLRDDHFRRDRRAANRAAASISAWRRSAPCSFRRRDVNERHNVAIVAESTLANPRVSQA